MTLQGSGGTSGAKTAARREIRALLDQCAAEKRTEAPGFEDRYGLNCGGSDSFSGITANPALGVASDMLAALGGSPVLAETTEIFGAEHLLVRRARNRAVAEKLLGFVTGYKKYLNQFGGSFDDNPSPGNKEGGLTNILEKSLGAVAKAGSSTARRRGGLRRAHHGSRVQFHEYAGLRSAFAGGAGGGRLQHDRIHHGPRQRHRIPHRAGDQNCQQQLHLPPHGGQYGYQRGRDCRWRPERFGRWAAKFSTWCCASLPASKTKAEILGHHEFVPWRIGPVMGRTVMIVNF